MNYFRLYELTLKGHFLEFGVDFEMSNKGVQTYYIYIICPCLNLGILSLVKYNPLVGARLINFVLVRVTQVIIVRV